jgi:hypothetical protein
LKTLCANPAALERTLGVNRRLFYDKIAERKIN